MAGRIIEARRQPEYVSGSSNEVIGITEAKLLAVAVTDKEGKKGVIVTAVFGKDTEDGGVGVFVVADEAQMTEVLRIAPPTVKREVRNWLEAQSGVKASDVPATLISDLPSVGVEEAMAKGDVSGLDVGGE